MKPAILVGIVLAVLALSAVHAAQSPSLEQLHAAIFSPNAPGAQEAIPAAVLHCSPPPRGCAYPACTCEYFTCSKCGVASFTCDPATLKSTCKCKTC
jgi:hypothetical protein